MRDTMAKIVGLVTLLAFWSVMFHGPSSSVLAETRFDIEVIVKISEKGFFDQKNKLIGPRNPIKVPEGKRVKVTFVFDEALTSLAIGDAHQIAIMADNGWTVESDKTWVLKRKTSLSFVAGEGGMKRYRGYCIIDCIGMDQLNNLVIKVA